MIEFSNAEVIFLIQLIEHELKSLRDLQNRDMLELHQLTKKELLHSVDRKLDAEFELMTSKNQRTHDL